MIEVEDSGDIRTVILNRPDKANSLTEQMLADLVAAMRKARDARAVILTGRGKVFSAGADLDAARAGLATSPLWEELSQTIVTLPAFTIAALNGTLAGGAFGMALACDIRIAPPSAKFFYPVMTLGFLPQPSDPARLAALIGPSRAKLILMGAQRIDAAEALSFGLIDRIVPQGEIISQANELVAAAVQAPPEIAFGVQSMCP